MVTDCGSDESIHNAYVKITQMNVIEIYRSLLLKGFLRVPALAGYWLDGVLASRVS